MTLNEKIRHFYDTSTNLWLDTWGEHMHHGYYGANGLEKKDHQQAQTDLVNELLSWGNVLQANQVLDAGCGVGGSARHLAKRLGANVKGLTLSPVQAAEAKILNKKAGLSDEVEVIVKDMLTLTPADGAFDLVWSMESGEHIPDKVRMLQAFYDVLKPGGKLLMATWCIRDEPPALNIEEKKLLKKIGELYHIPPMISIEKYQGLAQEAGFSEVKTGDWTKAVSPFWKAVLLSAMRFSSIIGLLKAGWPAIRGAWALQYMMKGYQSGVLKFGVLQAKKA
ncbi:MAG: methyltransferase domain-containing protein [Bacteroidetes bacterium]|nr:methyltransferase domain-containing protein [Bacteroidota bacterium]